MSTVLRGGVLTASRRRARSPEATAYGRMHAGVGSGSGSGRAMVAAILATARVNGAAESPTLRIAFAWSIVRRDNGGETLPASVDTQPGRRTRFARSLAAMPGASAQHVLKRATDVRETSLVQPWTVADGETSTGEGARVWHRHLRHAIGKVSVVRQRVHK